MTLFLHLEIKVIPITHLHYKNEASCVLAIFIYKIKREHYERNYRN